MCGDSECPSCGRAQGTLFEAGKSWDEHWKGMPQYEMKDLEPWQSVTIHFRNRTDREAFAELIGQKITAQTKSLWHPKQETPTFKTAYVSHSEVNPRYPVYVISKGRWERRLTSRALEEIKVPYWIVVEPQEYYNYAAVIEPSKILTLPFSNLGQGSIPARNWVWEHANVLGALRHWILDDNIDGFIRQHQNRRIPMETGAGFRAVEDFADRYTNLALAGFNYRFLGGGTRSDTIPPFIPNTRIYSCILILNEIPYRWRGRYNEDTDLSLRALKDGWCTALFNSFKINKIATMTMKGGNTDDLYKEDGRLQMAKSLCEQHPDVSKITWKFKRWQHQVDYSRFKDNALILKPDAVIPEESQDYGMTLREFTGDRDAMRDADEAAEQYFIDEEDLIHRELSDV